MKNVDCKWNDRGAWCKNENIKYSLFGIGARCCVEYEENVTGMMCLLKEPMPKPKYPPPAPSLSKSVKLLSYKILTCVTTQELEAKVNAHIEKGFILLGRPFLAQNRYHQAMKQMGFKNGEKI